MEIADARVVACALDCEGTLSLSKHKTSKTKCGYTWQAMGMITNCNLELLEYLQNLLPVQTKGYIRSGNSGLTKNGQPIYKLYFSPRQLERLLLEISPYLIVKRYHSLCLLKAMPLILLGMGSRRTEEQSSQLEMLYMVIRNLNRRKVNSANQVWGLVSC